MEFRRMEPGDASELEWALYFAIHVPPGEEAPPWEAICDPHVWRYYPRLEDEPDLGYLAIGEQAEVTGGAWFRLWDGEDRGYGYVDASTPELSIAVWPDWRGQGVGSELLQRLLADAEARWNQVSLSVSKTNRARRLYERFGFEIIGEDPGAWLMLRRAARENGAGESRE
jgi:GNAT superfamily N-acetyltransferase